MDSTYIQIPRGLTTDGLLGKRYLARSIDSVIMLVATFLVFFAEGAIFGPVQGLELLLLSVMTLPPIWIGYSAALESSPWQATIGKKVMGLRVYSADGGRLSPAQAAGRALVKDGPFLVLGVLPMGRLLGFLWLVAHMVVIHQSQVNQAIHDRVAGTWVAAPEDTTRLRLS